MTRPEVQGIAAEAARVAVLAERSRLERILDRHSALAQREGRTDLARMLDRLGDALTACGDDGEAPLRVGCYYCGPRGTVPADKPTPPCDSCGGTLTVVAAEDL